MYDLTSVRLPVLSGTPLRLLRWCMEQPRVRNILAPSLLTNAGVTAYRAHRETAPGSAEPDYTDWQTRTTALPPVTSGAAASEADTDAAAPPSDAAALRAAYLRGALTPSDVAERFIALRSDATYQRLNAFIAYDDDALRRDAAASSDRYAAGSSYGPLDGIPVSIKDEFGVAGYRTGGGTEFRGHDVPAFDATPVARLRAAGALIMGKGQMHEIGLGVVGTNLTHGPARNPHHLGHTAGGSSGGAAAAVASGLVPIAIGADGGGSIRVPAAFCGLYGLKPTYGRVSSHGSAGVVWSMSHPGPLAATVADLTHAYLAIAGADPQDPASLRQPAVVAPLLGARALTGVRVGYVPAWFSHADAETVARCTEILTLLTTLGAEVSEIEIPQLEAARVAHTIIITTEILTGMGDDLVTHAAGLTDETRLSLALARAFTADDVARARQTRSAAIARLQSIFQQVDLVVSPTAGLPAPQIRDHTLPQGMSDLSSTFEIMRYAFLANLTGLPALSLPAGTTSAGLPVGFQLMAGPWHEALLLEVASALEPQLPRLRAPHRVDTHDTARS